MDIDEDYIKCAVTSSIFARQEDHLALGQAAAFNTTDADEQMIDDSEEPAALPFKLTISEYDEIAQRLEASLKQLDLLKTALLSPENLEALRERVERDCDKMTMRIKFGQKHAERQSTLMPGVITDVYKVSLVDVEQPSFLLLKSHKKNRTQFQQGDCYLIDKVKLVINPRAEVVLESTTLTVLRSESEDSFTVESLELSQKQHEEQDAAIQNDTGNPLIDFSNNEMLAKGCEGALQDYIKVPYILTEQSDTVEPPIYTSIKQITTNAQRILTEWSDSPELTPRLWSFREILSWKIPDHLLSTSARESQLKLKSKQAEDGYICSYAMHTHLYQIDMVTQRIKEQKVSFVGIVTHVKEFCDSKFGGNSNDKSSQNLLTSHIDLESTDDKSKCALFVKHSKKIDLKNTLKKGYVLLVREALRKISNQIDIYTQLQFSANNFRVIGHVKDSMTDFQAKNTISLIKTLPTDQIVRHIIKVLGFIVETQFIKIQLKCDVCRTDVSNEEICRNGCLIKKALLQMQVLCNVQDGTTKASLELKNERVLTAFAITEEQQKFFREYCIKYGSFMSPCSSSVQNPMFREVLNIFQPYGTWQQMIFYCKPYAKATNEKRSQQQYKAYGDTISKPSFLIKEKEKEIFLNGEVQLIKKTHGYGEQGRTIKKTIICLKCINVENTLNQEALRSTFALKQNQAQHQTAHVANTTL